MKKLFSILLLIIITFGGLNAQSKGLATYYGRKFNNKKTASGEMYRKDSMVCAHKTYPFGTLLKVKSQKNDKEVIVRVIDRGPFRKKCIIDLSYAAAKELDMVHHGILSVEVSEYKPKVINVFSPDSLCINRAD